jgi:tetratricopeptide (TPR) repeat protein
MIKRLHSTIFLVVLLAVTPFILYSNTFNSPFALDDLHNIIANKPIRITDLSFDALTDTFKNSLLENRPVANLSLAFNYYLHRYEVFGYHVFNIIIHSINGILLFFFLQHTLALTSGDSSSGSRNFTAFVAVLLWLVHPLQTQSVTYTIQRMNSMAAMFYLLSFICYIRARISRKGTTRLLLGGSALAAAVLAIGSKENAVMLPVFILLYEWFFFQDLQLRLKKSHYFILAGLLLFLLGAVFFYLGPDPIGAITNYSGRSFTLQERLLTELRVVVFYISLVLFPLPGRMTLEHNFALSHSLADPLTTLFSLALLATMLLTAFLLARRQRLVSFAILWFLGNLLIESSFIPLEIIFEHRTYLPSMLLVFLLVFISARMITPVMVRSVLVVAIALLLSGWTYARNSIWENDLTLWADIAQKAPAKPRAQMNYGIILSNNGRMAEAMVYLERAVRLAPENAIVHYSLGDALMKQNKYIEASRSYSRALQLEPANNLARFNLAKSLASAGKHGNALFHYRLAAGKDPFISHQVYYFMGNSLFQLGRYNEAVSAYRKALQLKPGYGEALLALSNTRKIIRVLQTRQQKQEQ